MLLSCLWEVVELVALGILGVNLVSAAAAVERRVKGLRREEIEKMYRGCLLREKGEPVGGRWQKWMGVAVGCAFYVGTPGRVLGYRLIETFRKPRRKSE